MIKAKQIINLESNSCIYTNEEKTLLNELNNKLRENIMTSHKSYTKYLKNIKQTMDKFQFQFNERRYGNMLQYKRNAEIRMERQAMERDFDNVSIDKYISTYISYSLLYFFNMKTYYCPKCNRLKSLSGVHEKLECCGIEKVVVNVSTKMNDTAILTKVEKNDTIIFNKVEKNNTIIDSKLNTLKTIKKAEIKIEGDDVYQVIDVINDKYKNNGYNIVKDGKTIWFTKHPLIKDDLFIIVNGKIEQMDCLDTIIQLDKDIIHMYKMQNMDLDLKTLYSNLSKIIKVWKPIKEITPENILALSLIYKNDLLSKISHSFVLNMVKDIDFDMYEEKMFKCNKLRYSYFIEELNVLIKTINDLLPNDDIDDVLNQINNNEFMKSICFKHTKIINETMNNIIKQKIAFQNQEMKNEFYSLLICSYKEDINTLSFVFSQITQSHRLTSTEDMERFIRVLNKCTIVNNKIEYNSTDYSSHLILNVPFFYKTFVAGLEEEIYYVDSADSILELSDRTVSKIIKHKIIELLILVRTNSKIYYTSWFAPDVLEQLFSDHIYALEVYEIFNIPRRLKGAENKFIKITQSMDLKETLNFLAYFTFTDDDFNVNIFLELYDAGKVTTKILKTLFINKLRLQFLKDFENLKSECEELFPELVGRKINYDRIIMEHDYYMQRRREGTVDMTSVFNDRYVKFKPFNMSVHNKKYIIEAPREVKDLIHEGVTQKHCMDSYGKNIETGQEMVLFVRLKRGEPLYAVSLNRDGNVVQSSGEAHSAVPGEVLAQLQREFANDKSKKESLEHFFNCR